MSTTATNRPNILWIFIEDQDPRYSCYGEPLVDTPNVDNLGGRFIIEAGN